MVFSHFIQVNYFKLDFLFYWKYNTLHFLNFIFYSEKAQSGELRTLFPRTQMSDNVQTILIWFVKVE